MRDEKKLEGLEEFCLCVTGMEAEINCPKPGTGTQFQTSDGSSNCFFSLFLSFFYFEEYYFCATIEFDWKGHIDTV